MSSTEPAGGERRHYTPDKLGRLCAGGCNTRLVKALEDAGIHTHPTCRPPS